MSEESLPALQSCDALNAFAYSLMRLGDYAKATYWIRRALDAEPTNKHALNNLASSLKALGREPEAIALYERLTRDEPDFLPPFNNLAFSYLRLSRFEEGWSMYRHRLKANEKRRVVVDPITGKHMQNVALPALSELEGKDVLLAPEQGLGDELFFLRFVPKLIQLSGAARVWYAPTLKLYPLLKGTLQPFGLADSSFHNVPRGNAVSIPLGDLPLVTGHDGTWFPEPVRLPHVGAPGVEPSIGVTWRAGNAELVHKGGIFKGVPPEQFGHALRNTTERIVVMQRQVKDDELAAFRRGLGRNCEVFDCDGLRPSSELRTLCERLASLSSYVGVSNTNMHLLAGMGLTARVLVIHPSEWRWPVAEPHSCGWFPGFKLYRQNVMGWKDALEQLSADL